MKNISTELVFVLDRSGSMSGLEGDTIGGFNSMLEKQRAIEGPCRVTTMLFDNSFTLLHDRLDLAAVRPITPKEYYVGGSTALLDAIGMMVEKISDVQKSVEPEHRAQKVMMVIITDGQENASRRYTSQRVKSMIEACKEQGWEFVFLGANIDAVTTAATFGISADRAMDYVPDGLGTAINYAAISDAIVGMRRSGRVSEEAFDAVRKDMKKRGGR